MKIERKKGEVFNDAIYLSFRYSPEMVEKVKNFKRYHYHPDTKEWELPAEYETKIREVFEKELSIYDINEPIVLEPVKINQELGVIPDTYKFKVEPFEHQKIAIQYALTHNKFLLGDEMGTGKTKMSIDISSNKNIKHCLIVCGINGIKWNWKNEIEKFSDMKCRFLGQKIGKKTGKISIGTAKDKLKDVLSIPGAEEFYFVTNIETLRDEKISDELAKMCKLGQIGMVIVDEMHKCTNPESKQTQGLLKLNPKYKLAMTGTPLMNNPLDLYTILYWLDVERGNYWQFKSKYCVMEERTTSSGRRYKEIVGYKNLKELQLRLANLMLRRTKEEVLDLPEKIVVDEYVEMEKKQQNLYDDVLTEIVPQIKECKDLNNALKKMMQLRRVTSCPSSIVPDVECAKLDRMEQLVEECVLNKKSVIIFSNWTTVTDEIVRRLKKYRPALVTGKVAETERAEAIERFQKGDTKIIIGTVGAMGTGLNLTKATVEIFVDEPWTEAVKSQCEDRAHRIGQKNNITIYNLITKDTLDEQVHSLLKSKKDLSLALVNNSSIERFVLGQL